jgi:hypothetical protein
LHWLHILKWNLVYRFIIRISMSCYILGTIRQFFLQSHAQWTSKISIICGFRSFSFALIAHIEMQFDIQIYHKISRSSPVLDTMEQFLTELWPLDFDKFQ